MIEVIREFFHRFCGGRRPTRAVQREGDLTPVTPFDNGAGVGLFREEHSKEVPLPLPVVVSAAPKPPEKYEIWSPVPRAFLSAGSGASYFFLGVAGGSEVLSYDNGIPWYVYAINVFAGIGYALANYVGFGYAVSKDSSVKGAAYKVFCTLGALTFYTGGVAAGQILGFPFVVWSGFQKLKFTVSRHCLYVAFYAQQLTLCNGVVLFCI
ncbi:MAG: hypothetical protein EBX40_02330 [Gammaproteobacteria bacterium]|nr:hypothetical protein [Gammaproteobacteria bacterium]